jgi:hypothetical protein
MSRYWVRTPEKQSVGPFTPKQIVKLAWISEETMVYPEFAAGAGAAAWQRVRDVPELLKLVTPPPEAEPPPPAAPAAPPLPARSPLAPKLILLALAGAGAAFGYRYWKASQQKPPEAPPPVPAPAEAPAPPPSPADMAGYKNSRWGMTRDQAGEALETPLSEIPEFMGSTKSPAVEWPVNALMYELWGVPKSSGAYEDADIPDRFTQAKTASGDVAGFYGGKLIAYSFAVKPENFDETARALTAKYGPGRSAALTLNPPPGVDALPRETQVRTWDRGRTLIHLSRDSWLEGTERMTDAHLVYEGRDPRKQVVDAVSAAAANAKLMRRVKAEAERQDALKKLE